MNKELINKYKPEFDHWLNEGTVLFKDIHSDVWYNEDPWGYSSNYVQSIIINDEYVELRKALAEGKIIQFKQSENDWWADANSSFNLSIDCYRIKPDEPKFKVGDFVTPLNREINCSVWQIDNILSCNTLVSGNTMLDPRTIKPWTPVKNEWCWFYDSKSSKYAIVSQFKETWNAEFISITDAYWKFCEPFLNSLPSYLKDK